MIYIQRVLLLELALPIRKYTIIDIPQRPQAAQFESLNRIQAKYMVLGLQYPLTELVRPFFHTSLQITVNEFRRFPEHFIS
jgi:hypothetical protein